MSPPLEPKISLTMESEVANSILQGAESIGVAIARRRVRVRGDAGAEKPFDVAARAFPGNVVEFAIRDPRTGRYFASVTSGHFGPRIMHTTDPTGEWEPTTGLGYPEDSDWTLDRIWAMLESERPEGSETRGMNGDPVAGTKE